LARRFFLVALLYCEIKIINIAVCWNCLVLISTFQLKAGKNLISFTQSAGNLYTKSLKSSSEITRDTSFDFTLFNLFFSGIILQHPYLSKAAATPDFNWLTWLLLLRKSSCALAQQQKQKFIGFSEGEGAILTYKGRPTFVITQKEKEILLHSLAHKKY
jgi:hypothetical protein